MNIRNINLAKKKIELYAIKHDRPTYFNIENKYNYLWVPDDKSILGLVLIFNEYDIHYYSHHDDGNKIKIIWWFPGE